MLAFVYRLRSAGSVPAVFACAAAALTMGGCANTNANYAANTTYVAQGPAVPMESDGLPVQAAPSSLIRKLPDDPSQPFSPNYGGDNPARVTPQQPAVKASDGRAADKVAIPADLPPAFRRQLAAAADTAG